MCYSPLTDEQLVKIERSNYAGRFVFEPETNERIYFSQGDANAAYLQIQIAEMEKFARVNLNMSEDSAAFEWTRRFAAEFSQLWRKTHPYIQGNKPRKSKIARLKKIEQRERALCEMIESSDLPMLASDF